MFFLPEIIDLCCLGEKVMISLGRLLSGQGHLQDVGLGVFERVRERREEGGEGEGRGERGRREREGFRQKGRQEEERRRRRETEHKVERKQLEVNDADAR